jgi:hypothetical protein
MEPELFSCSSVFALRIWSAVRVTGRTADARHQLEEAARRGDKTVRERANAALAALPRQH